MLGNLLRLLLMHAVVGSLVCRGGCRPLTPSSLPCQVSGAPKPDDSEPSVGDPVLAGEEGFLAELATAPIRIRGIEEGLEVGTDTHVDVAVRHRR